MSATQEVVPVARRKREVPPGIFLVLAVVVVPALVALLSPRGFEPGTETFVYVAFAVVAGQTIAVLTAWSVLVAALIRRSPYGRVVIFLLIAAGVTMVAFRAVASFAEQIVRAFA